MTRRNFRQTMRRKTQRQKVADAKKKAENALDPEILTAITTAFAVLNDQILEKHPLDKAEKILKKFRRFEKDIRKEHS